MILQEILEVKRREVARSKRVAGQGDLRAMPAFGESRRGFARRLRESAGRRVIAEVKRKSPSRGVIRRDFDPAHHARAYEQAGATCLSVLTDESFFGGSLEDLRSVRTACSLPLLRKDFIIDEYQIVESRAWGADAVLLIVAALDRETLASLLAGAGEEGLDALVEVHTRAELDAALDAGATMIGINNRDLKTFVTSLDITRRLAPAVPPECLTVSESGLHAGPALRELEELGVDAFLVGESFMSAEDPGAALASFLEA